MALVDDQHALDVTESGWYPDPNREHRLRFHDGTAWTNHVTHFGPTPCEGCYYLPAS